MQIKFKEPLTVGNIATLFVTILALVLTIIFWYKVVIATHDVYKSIKSTQEQVQQNNMEIKDLTNEINKIKETQEEIKAKQTSTLDRGGHFKYLGKYKVTAYDLSYEDCGKYKGHPQYGITASGKYVTAWQTIAMDKSIPMGTKVYIPYFQDYPNKGIFIKEDHGGAIKGNRIDVYMQSSSSVKNFGVKYLDVYIVQ